MKNKKNPEKECLFGLIRALGWDPALEDQDILEMIEGVRPPSGISSLHSWEILDSFFSYLQQVGIQSLLERAQMANYRRVMVPIHLLLFTYMAKLLTGISSMNALPRLLFSQLELMQAIGFPPSSLERGLCRRGEYGRKEERKAPTPFSPQMLSNFIERFSKEEVETLFHTVIQRLVELHLFPEEIQAVFHTVELRTTEMYQGCGEKTTTRKEIQNNQLVDRREKVYGFKVAALFDRKTSIPLALHLLKIQENEEDVFLDLLHKTKGNLGEKNRLTHITSNRSPLHCDILMKMKEEGIRFYTTVKKEKDIFRKTQELAVKGEGIQRDISLANRIITITGLEGRKTPLGSLNTVFITDGTKRGFSKEEGDVFLTNDTVNEPLTPFKKYQHPNPFQGLLLQKNRPGWHLQKPPKKTKETMRAHVYLSMMTFALTKAYQEHMKIREALS